MPIPTAITAFYYFSPLEESVLLSLQSELKEFGKLHGMRGLTLVATEGINGTVCGSVSAIAEWKQLLEAKFPGIAWNDSEADAPVFERWLVKIRGEIVSLKQPDVRPNGERKHLSPEEWQTMLEQEDVVVLDTRNTYETDIGKFKGAMDPRIEAFHEFAGFVRESGIPKNKKVLMYCTGGIRCEKALIEMEKQGYHDVYQLKGGILAYLRRFPHKRFEGECFVFDQRVAVDQDLRPSTQYALCPHCGDPGDVGVTCECCGTEGTVCMACIEHSERRTCSKDCRRKCAQARVTA